MKFPKDLEPALDPINNLQNLVSTTGFLNLHWLLQAGDVMLASHTEVHRQLLISAPLDRASISGFMDDTQKLMEACNALKIAVAAAARSKIHVKYVIGSLPDGRLEASKMRSLVRDCLDEVERAGKHTGSWLDLELASSHGKAAGRKSKQVKTRMASKAMEEVSVIVLTALFAAFTSGNSTTLRDAPRRGSTNTATSLALSRLLQGIREEAAGERRTAIVLEPVWFSLREILALLESYKGGEAEEEQKLKVLLQQASKRLEYLESGLGIVEQQLGDLFAKLVTNRNLVLSRSNM